MHGSKEHIALLPPTFCLPALPEPRYSSNEELVAKASGGAALYGINFFPTTTDIVLKPYTPILAPPTYVQM